MLVFQTGEETPINDTVQTAAVRFLLGIGCLTSDKSITVLWIPHPRNTLSSDMQNMSIRPCELRV